jgi:hypothetical protein
MFLGAASVNRGKKKDVADSQNPLTRSVMQKVPEGGDKATPFWIAGENRSIISNNGKGVSRDYSASPRSLEKVTLPRLPVYDDLGQTADRYCINGTADVIDIIIVCHWQCQCTHIMIGI